MEIEMPKTMRAVALQRFGGVEVLEAATLPVPEPGETEVLVKIEVAGVGEWDSFEREGGYAETLGVQPDFPYVLGSEGAGTIVAVGRAVKGFRAGDPVYAIGFLNSKGGFYAEYAAVDADLVAPLPRSLSVEQAAVVGGVGLTALRGLDDVLGVGAGMSVLVLGASGGVGHVAVQLAKRMGARVLAVASGADGVALVERLGADVAVDGKAGDLLDTARAFAPNGVDAALLTAGGEAGDLSLAAVRPGGRAAYPNGVHPEPQARTGVQVEAYNGEPDRDILRRLHRLLEEGAVEPHVSQIFPFDEAAEAHRTVEEHHLGKVALRMA